MLAFGPALLVSLVLAPGPGDPGAYQLLTASRSAYLGSTAYADRGEIVIERQGAPDTRLRFETRWREGSGSYTVERLAERSPDAIGPPPLAAVWRENGATFVFDARTNAYERLESASDAFTRLLGPRHRAAALVALLLLAGEDLFSAPAAASVEGRSRCGAERCWSISATTADEGAELRLSVDTTSRLLREVELSVATGDDVAARALRQAGIESRNAEPPTRIRVLFEPLPAGESHGLDPFRPPPDATLAPAAASDVSEQPSPDPGADEPLVVAVPWGAGRDEDSAPSGAAVPPGLVFGEEIEVRLATVAVRVLDGSGRPIRGLGPDDFVVRVGGEKVRVEAVDWSSPGADSFTREELGELARTGVTVPRAGRLIVVFVQADLNPVRAPGHMRLRPELRKLFATLHPDDWIAVVSFDSHLKLRQDFTRDREGVEEAIWRGMRFGRQAEIPPGRPPSLARHFDREAAHRAASPERALEVVGEALLPLPGEKIMIFTGWGLGRYSAFGVHMPPEYDGARDMLARARVTVFVLDITQADYHSLEIGLERVALDTGGTYAKTFRQPIQMTERLAHALEGHYEISFALPARIERRGRVSVDLESRSGTILTRRMRLSQP